MIGKAMKMDWKSAGEGKFCLLLGRIFPCFVSFQPSMHGGSH